MRRTFLLNPNSVRPPLELHGLLVRYGTDGSSFGHSLSHLIMSWIAITTAHVTTEVLIITPLSEAIIEQERLALDDAISKAEGDAVGSEGTLSV